MLKFFDVHTHTQFAAFRADYKDVIERALGAGVNLINVGTQKNTSEDAIKISREYPEGVWATVGLHPIHTEKSYHDEQELEKSPSADSTDARGGAQGRTANSGFTSRGEEFDYDFYKSLADDPKVVAIGECGLDYYHGTHNLEPGTFERQKQVFQEQIKLAGDVKKPLMIHCREAFADLIDMLHASRFMLHDSPGVIHFFSGTIEDADRLMNLGFSFSFGGVITFTRDYDEIVKYIPLERILLETDAPYVAPAPYRGKRNEPAYVIEVAKKLSELKDLSLEEIVEQTTVNTEQMFLK